MSKRHGYVNMYVCTQMCHDRMPAYTHTYLQAYTCTKIRTYRHTYLLQACTLLNVSHLRDQNRHLCAYLCACVGPKHIHIGEVSRHLSHVHVTRYTALVQFSTYMHGCIHIHTCSRGLGDAQYICSVFMLLNMLRDTLEIG